MQTVEHYQIYTQEKQASYAGSLGLFVKKKMMGKRKKKRKKRKTQTQILVSAGMPVSSYPFQPLFVCIYVLSVDVAAVFFTYQFFFFFRFFHACVLLEWFFLVRQLYSPASDICCGSEIWMRLYIYSYMKIYKHCDHISRQRPGVLNSLE